MTDSTSLHGLKSRQICRKERHRGLLNTISYNITRCPWAIKSEAWRVGNWMMSHCMLPLLLCLKDPFSSTIEDTRLDGPLIWCRAILRHYKMPHELYSVLSYTYCSHLPSFSINL